MANRVKTLYIFWVCVRYIIDRSQFHHSKTTYNSNEEYLNNIDKKMLKCNTSEMDNYIYNVDIFLHKNDDCAIKNCFIYIN